MTRKTSRNKTPDRTRAGGPPAPGTLAHLAGRGVAGSAGPAGPGGNAAEARRLAAEGHRRLAEGDGRTAERRFRESLGCDPENAAALVGLGVLADRAGAQADAAKLFLAAMRAEPGVVDHALNAGSALWRLGRRQEALALFEKTAQRAPRHGRARLDFGKALLESGDAAGAEREGRAARRAKGGDPTEVAALIGRALVRQGRADEAEAVLRPAANQKGAPPWLLNDLGQALMALGRRDEAETVLRRAIADGFSQPGAIEAGVNLAGNYLALRRPGEADSVLEALKAAAPNHHGVLATTGDILVYQGRFEEARAIFREILKVRPDDVVALRGMIRSGRIGDDDVLMTALKAAATRRDFDPVFQADTRFAMAKALDDKGEDAAEVFRWLDDANRLRRSLWDNQLDARKGMIEATVAAFTPDLFRDRAALGDDSERPVLIVGMPRSGTTLVEQIIASHPAAAGGGEMGTWPDLERDLSVSAGGLSGMTEEAAVSARRTVLDALDAVAREAGKADAVRVVDKMPDNAVRLGLFALLFPRGRVIVCRRDPMDIGLSMYQQNFSALPYANALEDIGHAMVLHDRIMAHWRAVLPCPMLTVDYETLVEDLEAGSRRLIDFLGLPWEDRVLRFHETNRAVYTASKWQVRQPVYTRSVGRWRRYAAQLEPLRAVLAEAGLAEGPL